jgi:hypothetical protein
MKRTYDSYIEPCQLCISRNGATYKSCGWCHDDDTHYRTRDGQYPGDYVRLPEGGDGYPFHAMPHPTRQYYRNGKHLPEMDGIMPPDSSPEDANEARSRLNASANILELFNSGARPTWEVKSEHVNQFLLQETEVEQALAYNPNGLDITGKVEFRYLTYTLLKIKPMKLSEILSHTRQFFPKNTTNYHHNLTHWQQAKQLGKANISVLEAICHEAFHIIQAVTLPVVGMRFDAQRRLSLLKMALVEDFILDRHGICEVGNGLYELLEQLDSTSEVYHPISRLFGYCRSDIDLISHYTTLGRIGVNLFDLIEGSAFFFQKLLFQPDYHPDRCPQFAELPKVYTNAWDVFREQGGADPLDFLLFCHVSLAVGFILDKEDFNSTPFSPLILFTGMIYMQKELSDFPQRLPDDLILSDHNVREVLRTVGFDQNEDALLEHLMHRPREQVWRFLDIAVRVWSVRNILFDFMKGIGLSRSEYNNFLHLTESMLKVQEGFADERRQALRTVLEQHFPILSGDALLPLLLAFELDALSILLDVNDLAKNTEFIGLLGTEQVQVEQENDLFDITERLDAYLQEKSVFCCAKHGFVPAQQIPSCTDTDSLRHIIETVFHRKLSDFVRF